MTAIAAIVNGVSVIALVGITWYYAHLTGKILEESRKSREAAERQAAAAQVNVEFLQHQLEEQVGLGRISVASTLGTVIGFISYWSELNLGDLVKAGSLPDPNNLVPPNSLSVLDHARRISPFVGELVAAGFDNLQHAKNEIVRLKNANASREKQSPYDDRASKAGSYLALPLGKFQEAQRTIDRLSRPGLH